jgi:hypothetical protein
MRKAIMIDSIICLGKVRQFAPFSAWNLKEVVPCAQAFTSEVIINSGEPAGRTAQEGMKTAVTGGERETTFKALARQGYILSPGLIRDDCSGKVKKLF